MRFSSLRAGLSLRASGALLKSAALTVLLLLVGIMAIDLHRADGQVTPPPPTAASEIAAGVQPVELAPYMGELQRLTHKLSLSIAKDNFPLASFYLYESLEALEDIKEEVPEYRGSPVALLIDQLSTPAYKGLKDAIEHDAKDGARSRSSAALTNVINGCNQCHVATQHGFIKITDRGDFNPFNQDFKP